MTRSLSPSAAIVLQAIHYSRFENGASLRDIISYGDYINHAIFTFSELSDAVSDLEQLKMIRLAKENLSTTDLFDGWHKDTFKTKVKIRPLKELSQIEKYLKDCWTKIEYPSAGNIKIKEEHFRQALDEYAEKR
jgi:hypothetical protein